jgi:dihydroxyacetone synthase
LKALITNHPTMAPALLVANTGVDGIVPPKELSQSASTLVKADKDAHPLVLKTFRLLIADLCQQFNGGHPG